VIAKVNHDLVVNPVNNTSRVSDMFAAFSCDTCASICANTPEETCQNISQWDEMFQSHLAGVSGQLAKARRAVPNKNNVL